MAGKSPVRADEEQRSALVALSHSRDRGEADRARAILLTLSGWTSGQIAQAFGVREWWPEVPDLIALSRCGQAGQRMRAVIPSPDLM